MKKIIFTLFLVITLSITPVFAGGSSEKACRPIRNITQAAAVALCPCKQWVVCVEEVDASVATLDNTWFSRKCGCSKAIDRGRFFHIVWRAFQPRIFESGTARTAVGRNRLLGSPDCWHLCQHCQLPWAWHSLCNAQHFKQYFPYYSGKFVTLQIITKKTNIEHEYSWLERTRDC